MANRVVLGAFDGTHVLRVSRPGFNVLSTGLTPEQLAFDSRWDEAGNVFDSGSFIATVPSPGNYPPVTIPFGVTFPEPPMVVVRVRSRTNPNIYVPMTPIDMLFSEGCRLVVSTQSFTLYGAPYAWVAGVGEGGSNTVFYTVYRNFYG